MTFFFDGDDYFVEPQNFSNYFVDLTDSELHRYISELQRAPSLLDDDLRRQMRGLPHFDTIWSGYQQEGGVRNTGFAQFVEFAISSIFRTNEDWFELSNPSPDNRHEANRARRRAIRRDLRRRLIQQLEELELQREAESMLNLEDWQESMEGGMVDRRITSRPYNCELK